MGRLRIGAALSLCSALAGCSEPTIEGQRAVSPDHRYVATTEYDAPVLDHKDTYVFLGSGLSREVVYRSHLHDCLVLRWTGSRMLTIDHLGGLPLVMKTQWKPLWGGDAVTIAYHNIIISGIEIPAQCKVAQ